MSEATSKLAKRLRLLCTPLIVFGLIFLSVGLARDMEVFIGVGAISAIIGWGLYFRTRRGSINQVAERDA